MSIFPTGRPSGGLHPAMADREPRLEADGVLVRPISGQIYLVEEDDFARAGEERRALLSGLTSRH